MLGYIHWVTALAFQALGDWQQTNLHASAQLQIGIDGNFPMLKSTGLILLGWTECHQKTSGSILKMENGFDLLASLGSSNFQYVTHVQALIEGLVLMGRYDEALTLIRKVLKITEETGVKKNLPEVLRLHAVCVHLQSPNNRDIVEKSLLNSLELAKEQKTKLWELRTAVSLATLWGENKERQKGYDLLHPIYSWFTEGFKTEDLKNAKALLQQLE
jgi:hypothetical protein